MDDFLSRIESIGDNCELGFVLRNLDNEAGGLFRWSITPTEKLINYLIDPFQPIFHCESLSPCSPGMVVDRQTGFSFHSKMRSEMGPDGVYNYVASVDERVVIYKNERKKIDYLRSKFVNRLRARRGSIYIVKRNKGILLNERIEIARLLHNHCSKHVLVVVESSDNPSKVGTIEERDSYYVGYVSQFAPYSKANGVQFEEWNSLFTHIKGSESIVSHID